MADPDFIAACHERIRDIYYYWDEKRAGRLMPRRADLDPLEFHRLLPDVGLVDVVPDERRYVYRLIGTNEAQMRGRDPTGLSVKEAYFGRSVQSVYANYDRVVQERRPIIDRDSGRTSDDRYISHETIFMPLSDDGETVNMVMFLSVYLPSSTLR